MEAPNRVVRPGVPPVVPRGTSHWHSGKVRDLYRIDEGEYAGCLLMVASDRLSIFDHVLGTTIPDKGEILTRMSLWWFDQLADLIPNHVVSAEPLPGLPAQFHRRALVIEPLDMVTIECVARGYLTGSGLVEYERSGAVTGIELSPGLVDGSRLDRPIFTPTTKSEVGDHDRPMTFAQVVEAEGRERAECLRQLTLDLYARAEVLARERGIIVADTKIELGRRSDGTLVLADEVLTPDSSRFWPVQEWRPGRSQPSYDKQIVRNWALSSESGWDPESGMPPPDLPLDVVERTRARYIEAYEQLTGESW